MAIPDLERKEIREAAEFLEKLGYIRSEDEYSIEYYSLDSICINIVYPPYEKESDVNIRFIKKNKAFSIGWIALVRENVRGSEDRLENVKKLLKYIEEHHSQITDYRYCKMSDKLIDKYVEEHHEIFESSLRAFLDTL